MYVSAIAVVKKKNRCCGEMSLVRERVITRIWVSVSEVTKSNQGCQHRPRSALGGDARMQWMLDGQLTAKELYRETFGKSVSLPTAL